MVQVYGARVKVQPLCVNATTQQDDTVVEIYNVVELEPEAEFYSVLAGF